MHRLLILFCIALSFCRGELPYIMDLLPSIDQMEESAKDFAKLATKELDCFEKASKEKRYDEAYDAWSSLCGSFFNLQLLYYQTISLTSNMIVKGYAGSNLLDLHSLFRLSLKNNNILDVFVENGLNAEFLTPFQRNLTEKVLETNQNVNTASLENLRKYERSNFIFKTVSEVKKVEIGNRFKILTANILCFPNNFTYFFGGLAPWKSRIDGVIKKLIDTKADIICLQEVWDKEVSRTLIEKLKDNYFYFIYDAGNQYGTLSPEEIGFNSGLFIASRIPLESISFTPFERMQPRMAGVKRGAVRTDFTTGKSKWTLVATHLQHGNSDIDANIRKDQFAQCSQLLGVNNGCILGDLNINAFSKEFRENMLSQDFVIPYLNHKVSVSKATATATDYFNDLVHAPLDERKEIKPTYELIDYCVTRRDNNKMKLISQERVPFFSIEKPDGAISDHHGILTVWKVH